MYPDTLYDAAFQYKKTKLWKQLFDNELFAVRYADGEIGYCCVMGMAGEHISLAVYVGDEGFQSFREIAFDDENDDFDDDFDEMMNLEWMFHQTSLQCAFDSREDLSDDEFAQLQRYVQAHHMRLRGAHAWPNFIKSERFRMPWHFQTEADVQHMTEALLAAVALAEILKTKSKEEIGLLPVDEDTETLPLFIPGEKGYTLSNTPVPPEWAETFQEPTPLDPDTVSELLKLRKRGVYDCELIRLPGLLEAQANSKEAPYFPALLLCVDTKTGRLMATNAVTDYDTRPESLRDEFVHTLLENGDCPRAIRVRNEQTLVLLADLCADAHILFSVAEDLPALDDAREEVLNMLQHTNPWGDDDDDDEDEDDDFDMEEALSAAVEELSHMSDRELKGLPPAMVRQILEMANFGFVPQELQLRLRRLFKKF